MLYEVITFAGPDLVAVTAPGNLALPAGSYRWLVCGTLEDPAGNALGSDVSADFRVVATNLLVDSNFDAVITSYSIHYTKLYDSCCAAAARAR